MWINHGDFIVTISSFGPCDFLQTGLRSMDPYIRNWYGHCVKFLKEIPPRMQNRYVAGVTFIVLNIIFTKINFLFINFLAEKLKTKPYEQMTSKKLTCRKLILISLFTANLFALNRIAFNLLQPSLSPWVIVVINLSCLFTM